MQFTTLLVSAVLAAVAYAQDALTINTPVPGPQTCQPVLITWLGGSSPGPYIISLYDGNNPNGGAIADLGTHDGTSFTWTANVAPGKYGFNIIAANGARAQSGQFDVTAGSNTGCVGQQPSSSAAAPGGSSSASGSSASGPTSVTTSAPATSAPPTSSAPPSASTSAPSSSRPASSSAPANSSAAGATPTTTPGNSASSTTINVGLLALAGAAVVALV